MGKKILYIYPPELIEEVSTYFPEVEGDMEKGKLDLNDFLEGVSNHHLLPEEVRDTLDECIGEYQRTKKIPHSPFAQLQSLREKATRIAAGHALYLKYYGVVWPKRAS